MNESTILATKTFTGGASLAAVGIKLADYSPEYSA